ncbi:hypothetical protein LSUB1_G005898 [Lachnellula subtilissima]|uniref:Mediator of RNA polymerase II transcription subunit 22 n=1 Tax=Lachnellula subtilissima TaxID=602034 RepID=A0A8H8RIQ4_9HELO|nr:hypothetical protein LSUB1_G005898 [Lachnellula subtilissima]
MSLPAFGSNGDGVNISASNGNGLSTHGQPTPNHGTSTQGPSIRDRLKIVPDSPAVSPRIGTQYNPPSLSVMTVPQHHPSALVFAVPPPPAIHTSIHPPVSSTMATAPSTSTSTATASPSTDPGTPLTVATPSSPQVPTSPPRTLVVSAEPTSTSTPKTKTDKSSSLTDREERAIANMLTRFRNLVQLAAMQKDDKGDSATQEVAATQAFALEVESAALVRGAEDLLRLSRELKELWLFGPLRGIGEGEGEGKIDEDAARVEELLEGKLRSDADKSAAGSGN